MTAQELKNSILQHAVQGKLAPQYPTDEPASALLERIKAEKAQLIKDKKIKAEKPLAPITEEEIPFEIPESWEWVRLGEIIQLINGDRGKNYPSKDKLTSVGIPFISAINLNNGIISLDNLLYMSLDQYEKLGSGKLLINDLLFCLRGSIGKNAINQIGAGAIASSLVIWRRYSNDNLYLKFLYHYANSYLLKSEIKKYDNGTAQPNLSASNLSGFLFPLPPLAEQQRIVAKIEELMPLVEEYDKAEKELTELNAKFPEQIKKSVLQYAIQGKLVAQSGGDEPASELLKRIKAEKQQLIKDNKIKAEKPLPPITEEEIPFEIPDSWEWCRLGEIGITQTGTTPSTQHIEFFGNEIPFIKPADISFSGINYENEGLTMLGATKSRIVESGSVMMVCIGGSTGKCFYNDRNVCFNQQINTLTSILSYHKYLFYAMCSDTFFKSMLSKATGTATPIINKSTWSGILIPLPPLSEQQRIVEKVEEVLGVCEGLK